MLSYLWTPNKPNEHELCKRPNLECQASKTVNKNIAEHIIPLTLYAPMVLRIK